MAEGRLATGGLAALVSLAVYAWSAAPNVTLLDSGEFLVAGQHFGVPHPTGYPLWTLLNWLFLLLPFGNAAWEVAIFSGVCAAAAVGLCAALLSNLQRWLIRRATPGKGQVFTTNHRPGFLVDARFQPIDVVAGSHRGSLRSACFAHRGVSHSLLLYGCSIPRTIG